MELYITFGFVTGLQTTKIIEVTMLHLLEPYDRLMVFIFIFTTDGAFAIQQNLILDICGETLQPLQAFFKVIVQMFICQTLNPEVKNNPAEIIHSHQRPNFLVCM